MMRRGCAAALNPTPQPRLLHQDVLHPDTGLCSSFALDLIKVYADLLALKRPLDDLQYRNRSFGRDALYAAAHQNRSDHSFFAVQRGGACSQIAADSTLGAIIGAIGGGLLGREIDRGDLRCR